MKKTYSTCVLLAAAFFSLDASAGYQQFNLTDTTGANLGYFVQHDNDKTIAYYDFTVGDGPNRVRFNPVPGWDYNRLATTIFEGAGPTNTSVYDNRTGAYAQTFSVYFVDLDVGPDGFRFTADYIRTASGQVAGALPDIVESINGWGKESTVDADLAAMLDANSGYAPGVVRIVPNFTLPVVIPGDGGSGDNGGNGGNGSANVPEPASLALLGIGVLGLRLRRETRAV